MGIHRNYVNKKTHSSFLYIATNYQIWVYKRIFFMYNHISKLVIKKKNYAYFYSRSSFFIITNFKIWAYKEMKIHFLLRILKLSWINFF